MTERQKRFADYYLETGNARKAAVMAGYSVNYAEHVRRQPGMKEYLAARLGQQDAPRVASADEVLEFLTEVMRAKDIPAIRIRAAEMLAKRMGYIKEDGKDGEE